MREIAVLLLYPIQSNFQLVGLKSEINGWTRAVAISLTLSYLHPFNHGV